MEDRLSRVEKKIDTLQEAVVSLARVEERLVTVFNRQTSIESTVVSLAEKVDRLSESVIRTRLTERVFWLITAAAIGAAFRYLG
jgi:vacuolar-type H+-ATPase subunit E/Vma4|tara:strand:+ start:180 stop:431 length:252 start_codon:yes stop_codon:yes gene_type:complete